MLRVFQGRRGNNVGCVMPVQGRALGNRSSADVGQPKTIVASGDDREHRHSSKQHGHGALQTQSAARRRRPAQAPLFPPKVRTQARYAEQRPNRIKNGFRVHAAFKSDSRELETHINDGLMGRDYILRLQPIVRH